MEWPQIGEIVAVRWGHENWKTGKVTRVTPKQFLVNIGGMEDIRCWRKTGREASSNKEHHRYAARELTHKIQV